MKRSIKRTICLAALLWLSMPHGEARAELSPDELRAVKAVPSDHAAIPVAATARDLSGHTVRLRDLIDSPTIFIFADYTCTTLCGPILSFAARALDESGLRPGADFKFIVVGLDPKDGADNAAKMRDAQLNGDTVLLAATAFLIADAQQVKALTAALGYRYSYDTANDQFAHPAAAYVLTADGKIARVLSGLGLNGSDIRLALVDAGHGTIGTLTDQIHLLCYGFDPAQGIYNLAISRVVAATSVATVLALGGLIGFLIFSSRRRRA